MAKKNDNQDTRDNRHEFGGEGPDFDPNDPSQMPDGSPFPAGLLFFYSYYAALGTGTFLCCGHSYEYKPAFWEPLQRLY